MKKVSILLAVFLFGLIGSTAFGGTLVMGVPYSKVKVVQPRVVQKTVVAPAIECQPVVAVAPLAKVKVVQPRVVQRSVAVSYGCETVAGIDPTRVARVTTVYPRSVQRSLATPAVCGPCVDVVAAPRLAYVKVVQPRVVQRSVVVPPVCCTATDTVQ